MNGRVGVPVRVRRVSSELRELRLRSGLGAEEVAGALGFSMSKLSRIENGQRGLQADDVCALLGLYRVPAQRREELLSLVRSGTDPNWWQVQEGRLPAMWQDLIRFEKEAIAIHNYETMFIPGLLQTSEYIGAVGRGIMPDVGVDELDTLVSARLGRQALLSRSDAPLLEVLIEQTALERPVGSPDVMYRQLRHLMSCAECENITVRALPTELGVHPGMEGPFALLEFVNHSNLVYLEHRGNSAFVETAEHVAATKLTLQWLRELALSPEDSVGLIADIAQGLT
ncbi:helix-turn-helix domain-containing protein [Saccharopolyspora sp. K220]|uniref:helix-turn-helix domain-containing protein n=1 Tax=Saccharopolyspora soli TaxID=2926618 RepID=UPI001F55FDA3|nr:helix-turn-helix transcriptional regulator [Saccharopolyspora soli]MCI2423922.1 helix-turn-helix domain-containing protein [Saccharopolyspora soli]